MSETRKTKMPSVLAELHQWLSDDLTWLCVHWQEYEKLFASNERRIALLNATAPSFFLHFEDLVWDGTLLWLCRLTDPPRSVGKDNLTVTRLADSVDDPELAKQVRREVETAVKATAFARDWRNRRVAHRSLKLVSDPGVEPLASASQADVKAAISALEQVLNTINHYYDDLHHDFKGVVGAFEGSDALVYYLSSGLEAEESRQREGKQWSPPHW